MKTWTRPPMTNSLVNCHHKEDEDGSLSHSDAKGGYFYQYKEGRSPFDVQPDEEEKEDVFSGSWVNIGSICIS